MTAFQRGLSLFLLTGVPVAIIVYYMKIPELGISESIVIGCIIGMIPIIILLGSGHKFFGPYKDERTINEDMK